MPSTYRARIELELRADPVRSDHMLSELIGCHWRWVGSIRHELERNGEIPVVPVTKRASDPVYGEISRGRLRVSDRPSAPFYRDDPIDFPCCVAEWHGGAFVHSRSCLFRSQAASR
jgi:hypothetical protein